MRVKGPLAFLKLWKILLTSKLAFFLTFFIEDRIRDAFLHWVSFPLYLHQSERYSKERYTNLSGIKWKFFVTKKKKKNRKVNKHMQAYALQNSVFLSVAMK